MAANLGAIKWEDATEYIPALITALLMPSPIRLLPAVFAGRFREINAAVAVIAAAFLLKLIFA